MLGVKFGALLFFLGNLKYFIPLFMHQVLVWKSLMIILFCFPKKCPLFLNVQWIFFFFIKQSTFNNKCLGVGYFGLVFTGILYFSNMVSNIFYFSKVLLNGSLCCYVPFLWFSSLNSPFKLNIHCIFTTCLQCLSLLTVFWNIFFNFFILH